MNQHRSSLSDRTLFLRADADSRIATGHVMRCLALAQAWRSAGGAAAFISRCTASELRARVESTGAGFIPLDKAHPDPADLRATVEALRRLGVNPSRHWLTLDGYHFGEEYQRAARAENCGILVIDDYAHLPFYHADVLLNHNVLAQELAYRADPRALLLLGVRYALLRPEFLAAPRVREAPEVARKILVTLGGSDPDNVTLKVLQALQKLDISGLEGVIVAGAANPNYAKLQDALAGSKFSLRLVRNAIDMPGLMSWADVAIAAGGATCLEMAFMGLPSLTMSLAENQRRGPAGLAQEGVSVNMGQGHEVTPDVLTQALADLCKDSHRRRRFSRKGRELVDGAGAGRVVAALRALDEPNLENELNVRRAQPDDARDIWRLANDPSVRANSFQQESIPWEGHEQWYKAQLADPGTRYWIITVADTLAAQARYRRVDDDCAEVHFSVSAAFRGKGLGTAALQRTLPLAFKELGVRRVRGVVINPNEPSSRAFLKLGFRRLPDARENGRSCSLFELERSLTKI